MNEVPDVEEANCRDGDRTASKRFVAVWVLSLILSVVVLYFELDALAASLHNFQWSALKSETVAKWLGQAEGTAAVPPKHGSEPHGSPHIVAAAAQIFAVFAISVMWFKAFRILGRAQFQARPPVPNAEWLERIHSPWLSRLVEHICRGWWAVGMALLVVLLFAFTMHQAYQPAVLVMALIAIIVAAEHYSGLKEQQQDLNKQREQLDAQSRKLAATAASVDTVKDDTGRLAEDAGLSHFVHDVYARYAVANEIHAVVRMHEIDPIWWSFVKATRDPWIGYFEDARNGIGSNPEPSARRSLARSLWRPDGRRLKACFVTDLPMPGSNEWARRLKPSDAEPLFGDLLGFAWQWIVLQEVQKACKQVACCARVSRPLCWVHATDSVVFQVLRREPRSRSAALVIADRAGLSLSAGAEETYRSMVQWANEEVQRYADRGCTAEDYLLAVLRYAAAQGSKVGDARLVAGDDATDDLGYLLEMLGAKAWIDSAARKSESMLGMLNEKLVFETSAKVFAKALLAMFPCQGKISIRDLWSKLA